MKIINRIKLILFLSVLAHLISCNQTAKPDLKYPVIYIDSSHHKMNFWSKPVKTIILKDVNGEYIQLFGNRKNEFDIHKQWADSIYVNCKISDTLN